MLTLQQVVDYLKLYKDKHSIESLKAHMLKQNVPADLIEQAVAALSSQPSHASPDDARPPASTASQPPVASAQAAKKDFGKTIPGYVPPKAPPVVPEGMGFILVVDDQAAIRDLLTTKLTDAGYRATAAEDALQSVIQAEGMRLALLISDIQMPTYGTGVDALKKLRASRFVKNNLPVIFITGMTPDEAGKIVPLDDPYVRLMHKPVNWELLAAYIKDLTGMDKPLNKPLDQLLE